MILQSHSSLASGDLQQMLPQMVIPAVVAIVLVAGMLWLARKTREGLKGEATGNLGHGPSGALLVALAQKERELAALVAAPSAPLASRRRVDTPSGGVVEAPEARAGARGRYAGPVYCPACATQLGLAGPTLQYVTRCPACARWIATRIEGERVIVEARTA